MGGDFGREMIPALGKIADELNAKLPQKIDEHSFLVSSSAGPEREFTYWYSLPNHAARDLDLAAFGRISSEHHLDHACTDKGALRLPQRERQAQLPVRRQGRNGVVATHRNPVRLPVRRDNVSGIAPCGVVRCNTLRYCTRPDL